MLDADRDPDLRVYAVWDTMLEATEADVPGGMARLTDARVRHFWDGPGTTLAAFAVPLGLLGPAWDAYLVYDPTTRWDAPSPPAPAFWMHQLKNGPPDRLLDPARLAAALARP